jgi:L-amino acid N-acyltransferase YncA
VAEGQDVSIRIEPMSDADGPAVLDIYGQGIAAGVATFETVVPAWRAWTASHRRDCRFVAWMDGRVVGWTALARYSSREVYAGVAWESVYVDASARGRGVGRALLEALIPASVAAGVWTLIAGIQAENVASLGLHEAVGFRRIGAQERIGRDRHGVWRDVVLMERRSGLRGGSSGGDGDLGFPAERLAAKPPS